MKIILLYLLSILAPVVNKPTATLQVEITNISNAKGEIRIGIYTPNEKFGGAVPGIAKIIEVKSVANQTATFELEPGKYALAVYHDLNKNKAMDKNFVGIPKEPYGFSKNFRPKFSAPAFEDCEIEVKEGSQSVSIKLN